MIRMNAASHTMYMSENIGMSQKLMGVCVGLAKAKNDSRVRGNWKTGTVE